MEKQYKVYLSSEAYTVDVELSAGTPQEAERKARDTLRDSSDFKGVTWTTVKIEALPARHRQGQSHKKGVPMENPYEPALQWIRKDPGTGSATGLAKLILSLWNDEAAYSLRECCSSFDDIRTAWAMKIVAHFLNHGEDKFLDDAGKEDYKLCPDLWDVGYAGTEGKRAAIKEKDRQREEALMKKHPEWFDD